MAQEHKPKIEKQVETWGFDKHLIRTPEFESLLNKVMVVLLEKDRADSMKTNTVQEAVDLFISEAGSNNRYYSDLKSAYISALNHWAKAIDV